MKNWLNMYRFCGFLLVGLVLCGLVSGRGLAAQEIVVVDSDDRRVKLNEKGIVTLVLVCSEESESACREAGRVMDPYHGTKDFRHRVIVDLRDSWGGMVEALVKMQMRDNMDEEAERLEAVYKSKGSPRDPRKDLSATADFDGAITKRLGFGKPSEDLRAVLFDRNGAVIERWEKVPNSQVLLQAVSRAVGQ